MADYNTVSCYILSRTSLCIHRTDNNNVYGPIFSVAVHVYVTVYVDSIVLTLVSQDGMALTHSSLAVLFSKLTWT